MLCDVLDDIVGDGLHANGIHAPNMLCAPVPTFPGIRLTGLLQEAARERQEVGLATMGRMHGLGLSMTIGLRVDGKRSALVLNPLDLGRDDVTGIVPGDALVLGDTTVLRIALAIRIPIDALQWIRNAVLRIGPHLIRRGKRRRTARHARFEHVTILLDLPVIQILGFIELVVVQRPDASHTSIFHIDFSDVRTHSKATKADALYH